MTAPGPGTATVASRMAGYLRGGGIVVPLVTVAIALLAGGLVVTITGANPFSTYKAIFDGTGLNWLFPWISAEDRILAAQNLQQTLILTTPLILVGLAVAYAFRAGMFNIGGQGQYLVGSFVAVWAGSSFDGLPALLHVTSAMVLAAAAGALWGAVAGYLKARTGVNEVISTIMLNYIALWIGVYLFGLGGPLHSATQASVPISDAVLGSARLPVFWGDAELQGLHVGFFLSLVALGLFWVLLNRSVEGYEVRAVGFNPDAAEYAGMNAGRTYVRVMLVCGLFAGLAGALDVLGWQFTLATNDIQTSQIGFLGIAVALLGRNTTTGVFFSALFFGGLVNGTSVRNLDPAIFDPELAQNLTTLIQGLVVLLVSAPVIVTVLFGAARRLRPAHRSPA